MKRGLLACALLSVLTFILWTGPNEPQAGDVTMPAGKFQSLSYAPGQAEQVEADLRLIATRADGIRTDSANAHIAALAEQAGLKLWLGIRLGADPRANAKEIAAGIAVANAHPGTVTRVIVGSEVLRRGDLPVNALIADIDEMRGQVKQPVSYADSPAIWRKFPQVAAHVDVVMVDFVPYQEGRSLGVDASLAGILAIVASFRQQFPDEEISVGAAGWPSSGRWRGDAAPSRVNEAVFWRGFVTFARQDKVDYNLVEAFDRNGAYWNEGAAGASLGLWTAQRAQKFPLEGPVAEHPGWRWYAALAALMGSLLFGSIGFRNPRLAVPAFMLGNGFAIACIGTLPALYDAEAGLAAAVNLPLQAVFAFMVIRRADAVLSGPPPTAPRLFSYDSLWLVFLVGAAMSQALLVFDGRYRDAPLPAFIIPAIAALLRLWTKDRPAPGWAETGAASALALLAIADMGIEGAKNLEFLTWNLAALLLAAPVLIGSKEALLFVNKK